MLSRRHRIRHSLPLPYSEATLAPIKLLTPMFIAPNKPISMTCDSPVEIHAGQRYPVTVVLTHAATFQFAEEAELYPKHALGPAFAEGWNKTPNEIKVMILDFNLRSEYRLCSSYFQGDATSRKPDVVEEFMAYLRMTPDIAALAKEVFYTRNMFIIDTRANAIGIPKYAIGLLIRSLLVEVDVRKAALERLKKISDGTIALPNLRYLYIRFRLYPIWSLEHRERIWKHSQDLLEALLDEGLVFNCSGTVDFFYSPECEREHYNVTEKVETWVKDKITFENQ